jgi:hypothetical protein
VTALAVAAMAVDHLMGDDPPIFEDPIAFLLSAALCIALALGLFGWYVPRLTSAPDAGERVATRAIVLSALAVVGIPLVFWLGLPFILAGAGVALGLLGLGGARRRRARAAVILGSLVIALGAAGYGLQFVDKLTQR